MCTSTEQTFAWVGAIVVNAAFISFIAWGASTAWFVGFSISIVYTFILFGLATLLDNKRRDEDEGAGDHHHGTEDEEIVPIDDAQEGRRSILVSLLYGLSAIALGVTGYFLPVNLFYCPDERPRPPPKPEGGRWDTNVSSLPDEVQTWANKSDENSAIRQASLAYLPGSKTTLFSGTDGSTRQNILWAATASVYPFRTAEPTAFPNVSVPIEVTPVSDERACFVSLKNDQRRDKGGGGDGGKADPRPAVPIRKEFVIACCDGKSVSVAHNNPDGIAHRSPHDLFAPSSTLWYKDFPPAAADQGSLIFSLDPSSMEETLHSTYHGDGGKPGGRNDDDDDNNNYHPDNDKWRECRRSVDRKRSILALLVSALPVAIASILLWVRRQVPTMGVTTYVGISAAATCIYISIDPGRENMAEFGKWWYSISGAIWLVILVDVFFSNHRSGNNSIDKGPLTWGINFVSLTYVGGMIGLTGVFGGDSNPCWWRWTVLNLVAFLPLAVLGIATDQIFLLILTAVGFLMDSFRIAILLTENLGGPDGDADVPIFFVVLGTAGLGIAGFGWFLSRHQTELRTWLAGWMEEHSMTGACLSRSNAAFERLPTEEEDPLSEPFAASQHHEIYGDDGEQA